MGSRGDLLALVDGAPGRLATLQGALTAWTHRDRAAAAHRWVADQVGGAEEPLAPMIPVTDAPSLRNTSGTGTGGDTGDTRDTSDVGDLGEAGGAGDRPSAADDPDGDDDPDGHIATWPPRREAADEGPEVVSSWYVVVAVPNRWRVVGRGHLSVSDGRRSWVGTSTLVTERDSARAAIHDTGAIGACLYPGALLGGLELGTPEPAEVEGRPCWVVEAHARRDVAGTSLAASAAPQALRLQRDLVGVDHRLWLDAATGILLRHEGYVDEEMCSSTALSDLVFDEPIAAEEFRPPPGAVVRSRHELLRDHLSEMGIDPDAVDLDDPVQVRNALRGGG
jgi:hypothetical protein